jgi:hypothetical protein
MAMRYFSITFEWHTRPLYRKGRVKQCSVVFAAENQTQAYELAREDGNRRFPRHKWKVVGCEELTVPNAHE